MDLHPLESEKGLGYFSPKSKETFLRRLWDVQHYFDQEPPILRQYYHACNDAFVTSALGDKVAKQRNTDIVTLDLVHGDHTVDDCADEDDEISKQIVVIALKTSLMCNIKIEPIRPGELDLNQRHMLWDEGTVHSLLSKAFPKSNKLDGYGRLERTFHARNLERIGSVRIIWTHNLLYHLRVHDPWDDASPYRVSIFHHAQFLKYYENSDLFPEGFISETLKTLSLLLPGDVGGTSAWLSRLHKDDKDLDITACNCKVLDTDSRSIQSFTYWRDRLTILKQVYDESEPKTLFQWWNDGRKRERWATFWVAMIVLVLTILFGVIQCIEGGLQVYLAYQQSSS